MDCVLEQQSSRDEHAPIIVFRLPPDNDALSLPFINVAASATTFFVVQLNNASFVLFFPAND